ncbi:MAG: lipocalin family protein [Xanthomarina gelatinilytica]|uniref:lipocalin family protein n=1 Tax=Xanthomarina gelatinilytica TaxID=1137281 RepID=UPI003A846ABD
MKTTKHTSDKIPMNKKVGLIILFALTINLFNCSKDDDKPQPEPTTHDLLMSGKWYWESVTSFTLTDCNKQSYFLFDGNDLLQETFAENNENNCVATFSQTGTYQLNENTIIVTVDTGSVVFTITSISKDKLVMNQVNGSDTYTFTCIKH